MAEFPVDEDLHEGVLGDAPRIADDVWQRVLQTAIESAPSDESDALLPSDGEVDTADDDGAAFADDHSFDDGVDDHSPAHHDAHDLDLSHHHHDTDADDLG